MIPTVHSKIAKPKSSLPVLSFIIYYVFFVMLKLNWNFSANIMGSFWRLFYIINFFCIFLACLFIWLFFSLIYYWFTLAFQSFFERNIFCVLCACLSICALNLLLIFFKFLLSLPVYGSVALFFNTKVYANIFL